MSINLPIHNFKIFAEQPVLNQLRPVQTWSKTAVFGFLQSGPVFFGSGMKADWSWSWSLNFGPKNWTGPDFQALHMLQVLLQLMSHIFGPPISFIIVSFRLTIIPSSKSFDSLLLSFLRARCAHCDSYDSSQLMGLSLIHFSTQMYSK